MVPTAVYTHVASSLAFAAYNNSFNMSESLQGIWHIPFKIKETKGVVVELIGVFHVSRF